MKHSNRLHAKLSPSSASRVFACTASFFAAQGYEDTAGEAAQEGTAMHELAEAMFKGQTLATHYNGIEITESHVEAVEPYVAYLKSLPGDVMVEAKVHIVDELVWGTSDAIHVDEEKGLLEVIDLKTGYNPVYAKGNTQLQLYALGALNFIDMIREFTPETVRLTIMQPRHSDEPFSHDMTLAELLAFKAELMKVVAKIESGDVEFSPGNHCKYCPHRADCNALKSKIEVAIQFGVAEERIESLREQYEMFEMVKAWMQGVETAFKGYVSAGAAGTGYKFVAGRKNRQWRNEEEAEKFLVGALGDNAFTKKLKSVAQAEKAKVKGFEELVEIKLGNPSMVPESDPRPAIIEDVTNDFEGY